MRQTEKNPTPTDKASEEHIDYSEVYRTQELFQLNKRLKKTRNILLLCSLVVIGGAIIFWIMPESLFTTKNFLSYLFLGLLLVLLAVLSSKKPYFSILAAIGTCLVFWVVELILKTTDDLLIEGSIQKLIIISLLIYNLHPSKEAELIRRELHFS